MENMLKFFVIFVLAPFQMIFWCFIAKDAGGIDVNDV
jgi:hypothetical protein